MRHLWEKVAAQYPADPMAYTSKYLVTRAEIRALSIHPVTLDC
jgi:hypothetical protein